MKMYHYTLHYRISVYHTRIRILLLNGTSVLAIILYMYIKYFSYGSFVTMCARHAKPANIRS